MLTMKKLHACAHAGLLAATAAVALAATPLAASAEDASKYPAQPIKLMVPWPPGGGVDTTARIVSEMMGQRLGQPFVVDNRSGAGGNIGTELLARQKPDGYNLLMSSISPNAVNISLYNKLGFDPVKDFEPIIYVSAVPNILVVPADSPFKTVKDVIDAAHAKPGSLNYGSAGIGSSQHLAAIQFASAAKIDIVHVPYKGTAPAEADLAAGHVSLMLDTTTCLPSTRSGSPTSSRSARTARPCSTSTGTWCRTARRPPSRCCASAACGAAPERAFATPDHYVPTGSANARR
jgi:tripartite-type tricarboxylate transporter receptor subunit TctC